MDTLTEARDLCNDKPETPLDVIVGINPEVKDIKPFEEFLRQFGKSLSSLLHEEGNRYLKHHVISMASKPEQYERLVEFWENNPQHHLVKDIAFLNGTDPRTYWADNPVGTISKSISCKPGEDFKGYQ